MLPLRSPLPFEAGRREEILSAWARRARELEVDVHLKGEVSAIEGSKGNFEVRLKSGESYQAENVVLGIGLQGNLRKLGVPGENLDRVQYTLLDPEEFQDETIIVVGAGDAAIENALALAENNRVIVVNRKDEFSRAKDANNDAILAAIDSPVVTLDCFYNTTVASVTETPDASKPLQILLNTADGEAPIACDRIIGRLGAIPPRKFVESCGVEFPSSDPTSVPEVSDSYESNVPGLHIIGALAGFPLIKQCLNQGHEVIEFICGREVVPADIPLLKAKFDRIGLDREVADVIALIQRRLPMLSSLSALQLREFLLESEIHAPAPGEVIFRERDYTNSVYSILDGNVLIDVNPEDPTSLVTLSAGKFFGEMGLISGRRRTATVSAGENCLLIETPRRSMLKLMASANSVRQALDKAFLLRAIQQNIAPGASADDLEGVLMNARPEKFRPGEVLFEEGDEGDCLHLIRTGSVTVSKSIGGRDVVLAYVPAGQYVGEMALVSDSPRSATVRAAVATDTIRLEGQAFKELMEAVPYVKRKVESIYEERLAQEMSVASRPETGDVISFLMQQGLGEATDVLLIDESLCIRCDQCEKACASTHGNVSRLDREAGPTFAMVHVPTSCRHCEHPHCMKDCPPDAIHRAPNGEVFIDDTCIGCGNCERNCPYNVIHMGVETKKEPSLMQWLLTGFGQEPGGQESSGKAQTWSPEDSKKAVKCDMCRDVKGGPACERACPTGAAFRVSPDDFIREIRK